MSNRKQRDQNRETARQLIRLVAFNLAFDDSVAYGIGVIGPDKRRVRPEKLFKWP